MNPRLLLALFLFLPFCSQAIDLMETNAVPTKEQQEIWDVLQQKHDAWMKDRRYIKGKHGESVPIITWATYEKSLVVIDVAGCPEDFRIDWAEYVGTVKHQAGASQKMIIAGLTAYFTGHYEALLGGMDFTEHPRVPWQKLTHRAHVYKVKVWNDAF
jgi:hypothetical protein